MIRRLWKSASAMLMALLLYTAAPQVMASPSAADHAAVQGYMSTIMEQPYDKTDLAHKSLVRLFGGFIFKPFGGAPSDAPTVLAKVLGYTNVIAMILGVIIMSYVIVAGALNTAASGEMLGKSWSSVWLPLRTSLAFGMIVPATNGGEVFSVAQSLVIWMIIVGSNSATWLWQQGAQSIISGDPVMPKVNFHDSRAADPLIDAVMCSAIRNSLLVKKDGGTPDAGYVVNQTWNGAKPTYTYTKFTYDGLATANLSKAHKIVLTGCGEIIVPSANAALNGTNLEAARNNQGWGAGKSTKWETALQNAFEASSKSELPAFLKSAKTMADEVVKSKVTGKSIEAAKSVGEASVKAMQVQINDLSELYGAVIGSYDTYLTNVQTATLAGAASQDWADQMTKGGWMRAGAWFFETSRLQGFTQSLMSSLTTASKSTPDEMANNSCVFTLSYSNCKEQREEYGSMMAGYRLIKASSSSASSAAEAASSKGNMSLKTTVKVGADDVDTMSSDTIDTISKSMSMLFLNTVMGLGEDDAMGTGGNVASNDWSTSNSAGNNMSNNVSGMISPFTAVSSLGRGLQQIGVTVWFAGLGASALLGVTTGLSGDVANFFTAGGSGAAIGMLKYVMASIAPVLAGIGGLAFMLAFAIPFMPVTIWIMLVCGYLVTVIEAVAAAPLAVIMLATPEGEGISGSSFKQALQMINAIILRPSLSIVGLFAAMTLSYAGFAILNDLFWSVAGLTTNFSIFEVLAMIFIYSTLAFKICEYMVSVIHKIPDHIMQWMGGGMSREFGEAAAGGDMVGALKSNTAASGVSGVAGMKTAGGIVGDRVSRDVKKREHEATAQRHAEMKDAMGKS